MIDTALIDYALEKGFMIVAYFLLYLDLRKVIMSNTEAIKGLADKKCG